jgi:hypothetical protein
MNAACTNLNPEGTRRHIRAALAAGASRNEILMILKMGALLAIHSCSLGAPMLLEEAKAAGVNLAEKPATPTPASDKLRAVIGVVLLFSTLIATTLAITRERETGTMENLLAMPVSSLEVMLGKIVPYIGLGYVAATVFAVPIQGSLALLLLAIGVFMACNLAIGFTLSSLATTQMQAQQLAVFMLLPSLLLSGFMFPFAGMPAWARAVGECLPLTHIVRICRGHPA